MTTALATKPAATFSLSPQNFEQALTFSQYLADSDMVPKDFKGRPGNCLVAIQWGAEIGLQPLQALQNLAVINGRPALWGDAVIALVRSSPLCEYVVETQTDSTATCKVKRRGEPESVRTFSLDDAKKAGLLGKQGPWSQYPKRMMQMRARAFALRDVFPDVLRGLPVAEEVMDAPKDMGQAQEVQPASAIAAPAISEGLLEAATNAAEEGVAAYAAFWKATSADNRKAIGKDTHNRLKDVAAAVDAARTVDAPMQGMPTPQPATVRKPFSEVMQAIASAQNIDALYVAGEWIGTMDTVEENDMLSAKFDEVKNGLDGVQ